MISSTFVVLYVVSVLLLSLVNVSLHHLALLYVYVMLLCIACFVLILRTSSMCLGPSASAAMKGMEIRASISSESSILAFSAALGSSTQNALRKFKSPGSRPIFPDLTFESWPYEVTEGTGASVTRCRAAASFRRSIPSFTDEIGTPDPK